MKRIGIVACIAYIGTIFAANWALTHIGDENPFGPNTIPVWPGLVAPSGVLFAGLAFTFRDVTHRFLGVRVVLLAILVGAACSWFVSPQLAVASAVAFGLSELLDLSVYAPLERRSFVGAVVASNVAGLVLDSWLFLTLAGFGTAFLAGQIVGKLWMTVLAVPVVYGLRRVRVA